MINDMQFNEPGMNYAQPPIGPQTSFLTSLIIKMGLAKDVKQAQIILVIIGVLALVVMFFAWPRNSIPTPVNNGTESIGLNPSNDSGRSNTAPPIQDDLLNF